MTEFTQAYVDLLIKQYWDRPNAVAEITAQASTWETIRDLVAAWPVEFDLDYATADRLDILGKILGLARRVPFIVPKSLFGFADNPYARTLDDKFIDVVTSGPLADRFSPSYTDLELDDHDYRLFLRVKAARNAGSAYMVSDTRISIQDVINAAFEGRAYVVDRQNMTLGLYVSPAVDLIRLEAIRQLGLLPKPQGVRYDIVVQAAPGETFGFADSPGARGFADKFDPAYIGGRFALKVF